MSSLGEVHVLPTPSVGADIALVTIAGDIGVLDGEEVAVVCVIVALVAVITGGNGKLGIIGEGKEVAAYNQIAIPISTIPIKLAKTLIKVDSLLIFEKRKSHF